MVRPPLAMLALLGLVGPAASWTALVLSGGGAKGAYEVGVLESLCRRHPGWASSWSMVLGTSIGALGAGVLAQFPADQQCSLGVRMLRHHWNTTRTPEDVYQAPHGGVCLSVLNPHLFWDFQTKGGLCDPTPGYKRYIADVSRHRIHGSGMMLRVVASSMRSGLSHWWTEQDPDVVEGCMASGSIAPLVYPMEVPVNSGNWYVDGSIFANTPIVKALQEGASHILAILLDPLTMKGISDVEGDMNGDMTNLFSNVGFTVINYYVSAFYNNVFLGREIESACLDFPHAQIYGYIPSRDLGDWKNFTAANHDALIDIGRLDGSFPPVDLCQVAGYVRETRGVLARFDWASFLCGLLCASCLLKRDAVVAWCRRAAARRRSSSAAVFSQQLGDVGETGRL